MRLIRIALCFIATLLTASIAFAQPYVAAESYFLVWPSPLKPSTGTSTDVYYSQTQRLPHEEDGHSPAVTLPDWEDISQVGFALTDAIYPILDITSPAPLAKTTPGRRARARHAQLVHQRFELLEEAWDNYALAHFGLAAANFWHNHTAYIEAQKQDYLPFLVALQASNYTAASNQLTELINEKRDAFYGIAVISDRLLTHQWGEGFAQMPQIPALRAFTASHNFVIDHLHHVTDAYIFSNYIYGSPEPLQPYTISPHLEEAYESFAENYILLSVTRGGLFLSSLALSKLPALHAQNERMLDVTYSVFCTLPAIYHTLGWAASNVLEGRIFSYFSWAVEASTLFLAYSWGLSPWILAAQAFVFINYQ